MKKASKNTDIKRAQLEALEANPAGESRTLATLRRVLIKDDKSVFGKYKLNIGMKTANRTDIGLILPNAMLRFGLLAPQIMWEKEWEVIYA